MTKYYEFEILMNEGRLFFYHFREWKLPEPPYEVSIVGKTPRGRKSQQTENTCAA